MTEPHRIDDLEPGDHACAFCASFDDAAEQVARYFASGLQRGERCVYVAPASGRAALIAALGRRNLDVGHLERRGALVMSDERAYGPDGVLSADGALGGLRGALDDARASGFVGLRAAGHVPSVGISEQELTRYETGLDQLLRRRPASLLCIYDRREHAAATMDVALRTHARAVVAGRCCRNHFHQPFPLGGAGDDDRAERAIDWKVHQIIRSQDAELHLRDMNQALLREAAAQSAAALVAHNETLRLARAIEMRDQLFSMLARQLRAPLEALRGVLGTLAADARARPVAVWLENARDPLERLGGLVGGLDDIVGFLAHDVRLHLEPSDLRAIVDEVVAELRRGPGACRVDVELRADGRGWGGVWDRSRVSQVASTLLAIAAEHSWGTPLALTLEGLGATVRLSVRYRSLDGDDPAAGNAGGRYDRLGIQLFVTRELVRLLGGTLGIATWPDETVGFTVELPRQPEARSGDELLH